MLCPTHLTVLSRGSSEIIYMGTVHNIKLFVVYRKADKEPAARGLGIQSLSEASLYFLRRHERELSADSNQEQNIFPRDSWSSRKFQDEFPLSSGVEN